ncbi:MAG: G8 domain-containing protein [Pseudomonadota bacterium]
MRDDTAWPDDERDAAIHIIGLSAAFADAPLQTDAAHPGPDAPNLPVDGNATWQVDGAELAHPAQAPSEASPDMPAASSEIGTETSDAVPTQPVAAVVWAEEPQAVSVSDVQVNAVTIDGRSPEEADGSDGSGPLTADPMPEPADIPAEAAPAPSMHDTATGMVDTNASAPSNALTFPAGETELTLTELEAALGRPLDADDILIVPMGATLIIDSDVELGGLIVQGTATVADTADIAMSSDWVLVMGGGQFEVGTEANPHAHNFTLTLTGDDPDQDLDISGMLMAAGVPMMEGMGDMTIQNQDSFLMVMGEGSALNLHSADAEKTSWTQLDETAEAGATSITLAEATGWQIGDVIAIASTDFNPDQAEELTITGVSEDGKTISFEPPLDYMHYGEVDRYDDPDGDVHTLDMRAEVALCRRRILHRPGS